MTIVNDAIKLLIDNPYIIVFAIVIIALIVYAIKKGKAGLYEAALYLVSVAEQEWGSKTGKIKYAEVYSVLKKQYPIITLFMPEKKLEKLIEDALKELKAILKEQAKEYEQIQSLVEDLKPLGTE